MHAKTTGHGDFERLLRGTRLPRDVRTAATALATAMTAQERQPSALNARAFQDATSTFQHALATSDVATRLGSELKMAALHHERAITSVMAKPNLWAAELNETEAKRLGELVSTLQAVTNRGLFFRFEEGRTSASLAPAELAETMAKRPHATFFASRLEVENPDQIWQRTEQVTEYAMPGGAAGQRALLRALEGEFSAKGLGGRRAELALG